MQTCLCSPFHMAGSLAQAPSEAGHSPCSACWRCYYTQVVKLCNLPPGVVSWQLQQTSQQPLTSPPRYLGSSILYLHSTHPRAVTGQPAQPATHPASPRHVSCASQSPPPCCNVGIVEGCRACDVGKRHLHDGAAQISHLSPARQGHTRRCHADSQNRT